MLGYSSLLWTYYKTMLKDIVEFLSQWRLYHVSKDILPKLIYRFVEMPIKIPVIFSFRIRQANSKIHM